MKRIAIISCMSVFLSCNSKDKELKYQADYKILDSLRQSKIDAAYEEKFRVADSLYNEELKHRGLR